jgi:hypothetical protein
MTITVRTAVIHPGEAVDVHEDPISRRDAEHYASLGVLAFDAPPMAYVRHKALQSKKERKS